MNAAAAKRKPNLTDAYEFRQQDCRDLLARIRCRLGEIAKQPADWGGVEQLTDARRELAYALAILGDRTGVDEFGITW